MDVSAGASEAGAPSSAFADSVCAVTLPTQSTPLKANPVIAANSRTILILDVPPTRPASLLPRERGAWPRARGTIRQPFLLLSTKGEGRGFRSRPVLTAPSRKLTIRSPSP